MGRKWHLTPSRNQSDLLTQKLSLNILPLPWCQDHPWNAHCLTKSERGQKKKPAIRSSPDFQCSVMDMHLNVLNRQDWRGSFTYLFILKYFVLILYFLLLGFFVCDRIVKRDRKCMAEGVGVDGRWPYCRSEWNPHWHLTICVPVLFFVNLCLNNGLAIQFSSVVRDAGVLSRSVTGGTQQLGSLPYTVNQTTLWKATKAILCMIWSLPHSQVQGSDILIILLQKRNCGSPYLHSRYLHVVLVKKVRKVKVISVM